MGMELMPVRSGRTDNLLRLGPAVSNKPAITGHKRWMVARVLTLLRGWREAAIDLVVIADSLTGMD